VAGLRDANRRIGDVLQAARDELELAHRRIAELRAAVDRLQEDNDQLTAQLEDRPKPGGDVSPVGPTHPQCRDAAARVCAYCRPGLGYHDRAAAEEIGRLKAANANLIRTADILADEIVLGTVVQVSR
jgi:hypothetical protein